MPSFSLRTGRAWLLNPAYREAVQGLPSPSRDDFSERLGHLEVFDVLEIEVDGVNVISDVRESSLFRVVSDLASAAEDISMGRAPRVVTFGSPTTELVFSRFGEKVLVSLVLFGPPPEIRLDDLEIGRDHLFQCIQALVDSFLEDLREVSSKLASGPYGRSLTEKARRLRAEARKSALEPFHSLTWRGAPPAGQASVDEMVCKFELFEGTERLEELPRGGGADLYSLLGKGRVELLGPTGETCAAWEGPPYLAFRCLVSEMREVVSGWEANEEGAGFHIGAESLYVVFSKNLVIGSRGSFSVRPLRLVVVVLNSALEYCRAVLERAPTQKKNPYIFDVLEDAAELCAHCDELIEGNVVGPEPRRTATAKAQQTPTVSSRPLSPWKLRRVSLHRRWTYDVGPLLPGGFGLCGGRLLVAGEDGLFALDIADGRPVWAREDASAVWFGPRRSDPVLLSSADGMELVTPSGATAWSGERMAQNSVGEDGYLRGAGNLLLCEGSRSVIALSEADGTTSWRFVPPGSRRCRLGGGEGGALLATDSGFLYALDSDTGRLRWRSRTHLVPRSPPRCVGGIVHLVGSGADGPVSFRADSRTGESARIHPLPLDSVGAPVHTGARTVIPGESAGVSAVVLSSPGHDEKRVVLDGLQGTPSVLVVRSRIFVADRFGLVAAVGGRGRVLWKAQTENRDNTTLPPPVLAATRGVLLLAHESLSVLDPKAGSLLGSTLPKEMLGIAHIIATKSLNLHIADLEGAVQTITIGGHLSVVPD